VFAKRCIPEGIYVGPYEGIKTRTIPPDASHAYAWAVRI